MGLAVDVEDGGAGVEAEAAGAALVGDALQKFHHYYGEDFRVECPTGSGQMMTLWQIADVLSNRLTRIFLRDAAGRRPVFGGDETHQSDPHWRDHILFYEYFHGDTGAGVGASHQTGWTAIVAKLLEQTAMSRARAMAAPEPAVVGVS